MPSPAVTSRDWALDRATYPRCVELGRRAFDMGSAVPEFLHHASRLAALVAARSPSRRPRSPRHPEDREVTRAASKHKPKPRSLAKNIPEVRRSRQKEDLKNVETKARAKKYDHKDEPKKPRRRTRRRAAPEEISLRPHATTRTRKKTARSRKRTPRRPTASRTRRRQVREEGEGQEAPPPHSKRRAPRFSISELQKQGASASKLDKKQLKGSEPGDPLRASRSADRHHVALTTAAVAPRPGAVDNLSILARPYDVPRRAR